MDKRQKIEIRLMEGKEGQILYINNYLVSGAKPRRELPKLKFQITCSRENILKALNYIKPHYE